MRKLLFTAFIKANIYEQCNDSCRYSKQEFKVFYLLYSQAIFFNLINEVKDFTLQAEAVAVFAMLVQYEHFKTKTLFFTEAGASDNSKINIQLQV